MPVAVPEAECADEIIGEAKRKGGPDDGDVDAAERVLCEAKMSFLDRNRNDEQELRGAPGRPDPFSAAWRGGLMRAEGAGNDDGDAVLVDDFAGVGDEAAYIPLEGGGGDMKMRTADALEEEGEEGSGEEWELEQLRRAGHAVESDSEKMGNEIARRMVRAADEEGRRVGAVTGCLRAAREARGEWGARQELAEGQLRRLLAAERGGETAAREVERDIEARKRRLAFYDTLSAHVDDVTDMLKEKRVEIMGARQAFLAELEAEADVARKTLTGGVDEFGRSRPASLQLPEAEADGGDDVFADVADDVRSIRTLVELFRRWRGEYGEEYATAFGDAGLGKLAGRLGLGLADAEVSWRGVLEGVGRMEALRAGRAGETVAAGVRARWRPREEKSGEKWGRVGREVGEACGREVAEMLREVFCERGMVEMEGCVRVEDGGEAEKCLKGMKRVERRLGAGVGVGKLVEMMEEGSRSRSR